MAIHSKHTYNLSTDIYNLIQVLYKQDTHHLINTSNISRQHDARSWELQTKWEQPLFKTDLNFRINRIFSSEFQQ